MKDTLIKQLMRTLGALQASLGLKNIINNLPEITRRQVPGKLIIDALKGVGILGGNITQQDALYYSTSWEEYQVALKDVWSIVKNFDWVAETFDCDNRASLVTVLCGLLFGLNTCATVHCERHNLDGAWSGGHLTNIIIDKDGNTYLFDVDNHGMMQKITSNDAVMGREKYTFDSARVF